MQYTNNSSWFLSGLTLLFIALKLTGHIDWSWLWVLSPIWLPLAIVLPFILFCVIMAHYFNK